MVKICCRWRPGRTTRPPRRRPIGDRPVDSWADVRAALASFRPGDTLQLTLESDDGPRVAGVRAFHGAVHVGQGRLEVATHPEHPGPARFYCVRRP